jgi:hypothetical protein
MSNTSHESRVTNHDTSCELFVSRDSYLVTRAFGGKS